MENSKIIEINGVKFEVDERTATLRQVSSLKIGSRVKVLKKKYGDNFEVYHGTVVGFEPFKENPVVIIAYVEASYSSDGPAIKFLYYNNKSEEQVIVSDENDKEALAYDNVIDQIDNAIEKKKREIQDLEDRKSYFKKNFKAYWSALSVE